MGLRLSYQHHVRSLRLAISSPRFHQLAALLQRVAPPVGLFGLIADDVGQSRLCDFARDA
jgi:hypothetical protein